VEFSLLLKDVDSPPAAGSREVILQMHWLSKAAPGCVHCLGMNFIFILFCFQFAYGLDMQVKRNWNLLIGCH
jgi:hypothetical protein